MNESKRTRVVVVGGGFGGVKLALDLSKDESFDTVLISDQPEFRYYPSLFRAATGGSRTASAILLADIFAHRSITIEYQKIEILDRHAKVVRTADGKEFEYDVLVLALGSTTNYFGIKGLEQYSYGIKSLEDAEKLKRHIHQQLTDDNQPDLNYVVVGGGPTGIELAAELPGYMRRIMHNHGISPRPVHVDLIEASPRLMPRMPEDISKAMADRLTKLGIKLYMNEAVQAETADAIVIHGEALKSHTVVWTAGMSNNSFFATNNFKLSPKGRVIVDKFLQSEPGIYVLGDNAETTYTGMAQTALYDADFVAKNLKRKSQGQPAEIYKPKKPIYVMPAGPHWAAVLWGNVRLYGWIGWVLRRAADLVAYHDIEPWWKASKLWLAEAQSEEDCLVCK
ncbi:MAG TPA: FAD-dependent oxidoreductase [Patescibacteria group bacterium]|nr:FAD-dependent oxidoreductase [Patescibacteria group bacterium]